MSAAQANITVEHAAAPGRVRLHLVGLRHDAGLAARLTALARREGAWVAAEFRSLTGSVVIRHDPAQPVAAVIARLEALLTLAKGGPAPASGAGEDRGAGPGHVAEQPGSDGAGGIVAPGRAMAPHPLADSEPPWHALPAAAILARLGSDPATGLSGAEAARRLRLDGPNLLPRDAPRSRLALLADQFRSMPVVMLIGSAVVSLASGGVADAVATLAVVVANGVLGYVTEGQAEHVLARLSRDGDGARARVLRGGREIVVEAEALVRGDICLFRPGELITADARLLRAEALMVDESSLTGETMPVEKSAEAAVEAEAPLGSRPTMVHAGTIVTEGTGLAVVVSTGAGNVASRIALAGQAASRPQAPIEQELDHLGRRLARASIGACVLLLGIGVVRHHPPGMLVRDALALAVAAVPEGLPVVATTTMALGLRRMERRGILIRRIDAVESLGALQVLCLDKTGTLTQNRMQVVAAAPGLEECAPGADPALARLAEAAALNNDGTFNDGRASGASATETALIEFAALCGIDVAALRAGAPRVAGIARGPRRPWMATQHGEGPCRTIVKGAPDEIIPRCSHILDNGARRALDEADRARLLALNAAMAARPARVLAFAETDAPICGDDVGGLTWLGLVAMVDPIRPGAPGFIRALHQAGIATVMITGDQAATAAAIARELDLGAGQPINVIDAPQIARLDPETLAGLAARTHVFARVSADQKLAIVRALQAGGRVVGMTGDGVNDAPALKAADLGIAMGESGTELARDVANVVIRDDQLPTLIDAIAQGRAVYRNIRRALEFLVTTNASEIIVTLGEALHGPGEMETPLELLWINLVTDVLPGLGLALAEPDPDAMLRPPRARGETIVPRGDVRRMAIDGGTIAAAALGSHFLGLLRHGPGPQTRGMTYLSLSLGQLLYTMTCQRSDPRKLRPVGLFQNRALDAAVLGSGALALLPFAVPRLGRLLGMARPASAELTVALLAAAAPSALVLLRSRLGGIGQPGAPVGLDHRLPAPGPAGPAA